MDPQTPELNIAAIQRTTVLPEIKTPIPITTTFVQPNTVSNQ